MKHPKVFGIGFHKTATSSLAVALEVLGYRVTGPNGAKDPDIARNLDALVADLLPRYDAFQDNPWPLVYAKVDQLYPGSKFVLTLRPSEKWIRSAVRHFGERSTPMRELIYGDGLGAPLGNEAHYVDRMERHNAEVRAYFADRPGDLLEIDLTQGAGWAPLCAFLGHPIPAQDFPHANDAARREAWAKRAEGDGGAEAGLSARLRRGGKALAQVLGKRDDR